MGTSRIAALGAGVLLVAVLSAGCGGHATTGATSSSPTSPTSPTSPSSSSSAPSSASAAPTGVAQPSVDTLPITGPTVPGPGVGWTAFWRARAVAPAPPTTLLASYDTVELPTIRGSLPVAQGTALVRAALREIAAENFATDNLRGDIVNAGVLGTKGLSGDSASITSAEQYGLVSTRSALTAVSAAGVLLATPAQRKLGYDQYLVVLALQYGPFVGTYTDGTSQTLPAQNLTEVLSGHLVTARLLGTFLFASGAFDCGQAASGGTIAAVCTLAK